MTFSVIVPIYNTEKYISQCIESVIVQTYDDYELILVDDGSVDKSSDICKNYCNVNGKVKYYYKKN